MTRNQRRRNSLINRVAARVSRLGGPPTYVAQLIGGLAERACAARPFQISTVGGVRYSFPTRTLALGFARATQPSGEWALVDKSR